ncbi:unnamed protein product [Orchesella dallaii]|uniref:Uncharacterized protein n=1 Tax=Orchesella dallaii TaxID=48710 RepID=A0ABP1QQG9_9HEXA
MAWIREKLILEDKASRLKKCNEIEDRYIDLRKMVIRTSELILDMNKEISECGKQIDKYLHNVNELKTYRFLLSKDPVGPLLSISKPQIIMMKKNLLGFQSKLWIEGYQKKEKNDLSLEPIVGLDLLTLEEKTEEELREILIKVKKGIRKSIELNTWFENLKLDFNEMNFYGNIKTCILKVVHLQVGIETAAAYYVAFSAFLKAVNYETL